MLVDEAVSDHYGDTEIAEMERILGHSFKDRSPSERADPPQLLA